ncbi:hypothetical protein IWX49DRAFT_596448 [Phyllosticta citricarpa]|uniref:Uncharacterized protein n=2 Tax=Phyllosticta TaxID=121621 RepID=A0ABR1MKQ4_9PEZI
MMIVTVVANLPAEGLRSIICGQLATNPAFTSFFIDSAQRYLRDTNKFVDKVFEYKRDSAGTPRPLATAAYGNVLRRIRAMTGSGLVFDALPQIVEILEEKLALEGWDHGSEYEDDLVDSLSNLEGNVVQSSVTAIQKVLVARELTEAERGLVLKLAEELKKCKALAEEKEAEDLFERGPESVESVLS